MNRSPSESKCILVCFRHLNMSQVLQLGGVNEDIPYIYPQLQHKHFTGCIRNLIVDSKVILSELYPLKHRVHKHTTIRTAACTPAHTCTSADKWINCRFQHLQCSCAEMYFKCFYCNLKVFLSTALLGSYGKREYKPFHSRPQVKAFK